MDATEMKKDLFLSRLSLEVRLIYRPRNHKMNYKNVNDS